MQRSKFQNTKWSIILVTLVDYFVSKMLNMSSKFQNLGYYGGQNVSSRAILDRTMSACALFMKTVPLKYMKLKTQTRLKIMHICFHVP